MTNYDKISKIWSLDGNTDKQILASEVLSAAYIIDLCQEEFY